MIDRLFETARTSKARDLAPRVTQRFPRPPAPAPLLVKAGWLPVAALRSVLRLESCVLPSPVSEPAEVSARPYRGRGQRNENAENPPRLGIEPRRLLGVVLRRVC